MKMRKGFLTCMVFLLIMVLMIAISQPVYAEKRDFTNAEKELVEEALKFLGDNGSDSIGGNDASTELTGLLGTKAADGLNKLRRDTEKGLGNASASSKGLITVGLPKEEDINKDIETAEGFTQVKTLAQTLYHEWVHYRRFQQHGNDLIPALDHNWAKCQPLWDEVEAYYMEIKQKLSWKLAREDELSKIPGQGDTPGEPTPEDKKLAERLQREIDDLEKQIDEAAGSKYLAGKRKVSPGSTKKKSYEEGGSLIKDAFAGMDDNLDKFDEVTSRILDISLFYEEASEQHIEDKIEDKVKAYREKITILTILMINWLTGGTIEIPYEGHFMKLDIVPFGLYEAEEIEIEGYVLENDYMLPWEEEGCHILSPVYQLNASADVMANPDYPSQVTLSFNKEELPEGETPHIYSLRTESRGRSTADTSEASWQALLIDEEVDLAEGTISAKCTDPFSLFVVMIVHSPDSVETVELTADPPNRQLKGEDITFTATVTEGSDDAEFAFWYKLPGGRWKKARAYSTDNTWTVNTYYVSEVQIGVQARAVGSRAFDEARGMLDYEIVEVAPVEEVTLTASPEGSQLAGEDIIFTAEVTAGNTNAEFEFYYKLPDGKWTLARSYSTDPSWTGNTTYAGAVEIGVIARAVGSSNFYDDQDKVSYQILPADPETGSQVTAIGEVF